MDGKGFIFKVEYEEDHVNQYTEVSGMTKEEELGYLSAKCEELSTEIVLRRLHAEDTKETTHE